MSDFKSANGLAPLATGGGGATIRYTQNFPIQQAGVVFIGTLDSTGTTAASAANNPFGSSLSLQRIYIPGQINLSEIDLVFGIGFPATNQGQGSFSQSAIIYSFGNSTSLASVLSASRASSWATGSTTSGTSSSLQQGWSGPNIQPFTFASTSLAAGEYAVGHLLSWAAESTSWFVSVYGAPAASSTTASAVTNVNSASLSAASTFATASTAVSAFTATPTSAPVFLTATGTSVALLAASAHTGSASAPAFVTITGTSVALLAGSFHTATTGTAITAFTAAPTAINVYSTTTGLSAFNVATGAVAVSSYGSAFIAMSYTGSWTGATIQASAAVGASSQSSTAFAYSATNTTSKSVSFNLIGQSSNSNIVSNVTHGTVAGSVFTASGAVAGVSNAGTAGVGLLTSAGLSAGSVMTATGVANLMSSSGLSAGSFFTATGSAPVLSNAGTGGVSAALSMTTASVGALTAVATATAARTQMSTAVPSFGYNGAAAMTTDTSQAVFQAAILSAGVFRTGASAASIDLRSTAFVETGSAALVQPWFALVGA